MTKDGTIDDWLRGMTDYFVEAASSSHRSTRRPTHRRPVHGGGAVTVAGNILFLMTNQHRVDTLGAYGNRLAVTPALDHLARTGTRFDRWYTPTAICSPARASLLTGQAPFRHKLLANHERNVGYIEDLPAGQFTFSQALRERATTAA